jgi:hypothetical protein
MNKVSVMMILCNEEHHIIKHVPLIRDITDDLVIIVQKSQDRTLEICKRWADKCFDVECTGFSETHRQFGADQCDNEWMLYLEGDELPTYRFVKEIPDLINNYNCDGHLLQFQNCVRGFPNQKFPLLRLAKKSKWDLSVVKVHAQFELKGGNNSNNTNTIDYPCVLHVKTREDVMLDGERYCRIMSDTPHLATAPWYQNWSLDVKGRGFYTMPNKDHDKINTFDHSLAQAIANEIPKGSSIIDLGCGDGAYCDFLDNHNHLIFGVDGNPNTRNFCDKTMVRDLTLEESYDLLVNKFDYAICLNVGHCIPNAYMDKFIKNISTVDKLIVSWSNSYNGFCHQDIHITPKEENEVVELFAKAGYSRNKDSSFRLTEAITKNKIYNKIIVFEKKKIIPPASLV